MNTTRSCVVLGLILGLCAPHVAAQIVIGPQVRVDNGNAGSGVEPAVSFVRDVSTMEAMATAIDWRLGSRSLSGFGITFDGGLTWEEGLAASGQFTTEVGLDAITWADPNTNDIWLVTTGGQANGGVNYILALKRAQGVHAAQMPPLSLLTDGMSNVHIPHMAAGTSPTNPSQRNLYIMYAHQLDTICPPPTNWTCNFLHMAILRSTDGGASWIQRNIKPPAQACASFGHCEFEGFGSGIVVADREPHTGLIIAINGHYAIWSHDAGDTWPSLDDRLFFLDTQLTPSDTYADIPGPFQVIIRSHMALDETTGEFYIVASAKRQVGSSNLDLYVIRGRTRIGSPPIEFDPPVRLELDAADLAYEPDQFLPSIAIDGLGGINLLYYDTRHHVVPDSSPHAFLDAYYARIIDLGTS